MDPKDHAARRDRLRARAVTTTIVATVVAAPVLALWAAYRGAPLTGEGVDGRPASTSEAQDPEGLDGGQAGGYENAGNASAGPGSRVTKGGSSDVSVEVVSARGTTPGHLAVTAGTSGDTTMVTLTASGSSPVRWSARTGAAWLYLSRSSGTLEPGESMTVKVYVDHLREPHGPLDRAGGDRPGGRGGHDHRVREGGLVLPPRRETGPHREHPDPLGGGLHPGRDPQPGPVPDSGGPDADGHRHRDVLPGPGNLFGAAGEGGDPGTGTP